jgi:hypothetical protein
MIRKKIYKGTVGVSTNETLGIPSNMRVTVIAISQSPTQSHNVTFLGGGWVNASLDQSNPDKTFSTVNTWLGLNVFSDIKITNGSGVNSLEYVVFCDEYIT